MEYDTVDTDVTNLRDDAGIIESQLVAADEPVTLILGRHVNGNDVTVDVQHFAAISVERELDEEEQAMYQQETLSFSSILVAAEDGEASQEVILNVRQGGDIDDAIATLERVTDDATIDVVESSGTEFVVEDGEVVVNQPDVEELTEDIEDEEETEE